jgi:small subunit ribosomal protein S20
MMRAAIWRTSSHRRRRTGSASGARPATRPRRRRCARIKRLRAAIGGKNAKEAQTLLKTAASAIDSAASKGIIKRGTASRSVSRLTVAVANLK